MSWLASTAQLAGSVVMVAGGLAVAAGLFWLTATVAGVYAQRAWKNLGAIYRIETMRYWFKRMHDDGTHVLQREHDEKLRQKQEISNG